MRSLSITTALVLLVCSAGVSADSHGAHNLICSPSNTFKCDANGNCARGGATEVKLDHFLEVDLTKKTITGVSSGRTSPIGSVEKIEGMTVLHGAQNGRAWSASIADETGAMTIAVAGKSESFTVFGACMAAK